MSRSKREGDRIYDITIIGGGPTGLFAAFYAGMRQMKMKIIDALPQLGGQLTALYPEKFIYDMPGFPKVRASELVRLMVEQAMQFQPTVCLNETAVHLKKQEEDNGFVLETNKGLHYSRTILLCVGLGAFHPRRLGKPEVERFEGRGVAYTVTNVDAYRGKKVLIVGGGDSAVDWALTLEPIAEKVHLIHRRDKFRAHEHSVEQLLASSVEVHLFHELETIIGNERPEQAIIFHNKTGQQTLLPIDEVILSLGFTTDLGPVKSWGLQMEGNDVVVDQRMMTSIPGVFAAGDVATYPGKIKLIATGVAEAAIAVNQAKVYIDPTARLQPAFSTTTGIPTGG
ncbi:MAG: NAD(P)/FAD-dependent oxidoreductase [Armatimonadetes bacterium]|nr:NAD(P)/FAD-dependent oxidoreductase [Armatimonadota bacterium]MDW8121273.1 NAD(P)/FAD-dependent oxidoreductase [Armatimonadota bacterium]